MSLRARDSLTAAAFILAFNAGAACACGPFFPNRLLMHGDHAVLWAPVADFRLEIERLKPVNAAAFPAVTPAEVYYDKSAHAPQTAAADRAELRAALVNLPMAAERREALLAQHEALREALCAYADQRAAHAWRQTGDAPALPDVAVPAGLPAEFELYLRGAVAYHRDERDAARRAWQAVLTLPPEQRRYRSTWAAFMLGKVALEAEPARAIEHFRQVRELARGGFADRLGLASSSLGWEARAELARDHVEQAIALYLQQLATEDATAVWSLRIVVERILKQGDEALARAACDDGSRRVVTAYLLAHGGPRVYVTEPPARPYAQRWLEMLEAVGVHDLTGADRLAWVAYQAGAFGAAERWLSAAPRESAIANWIRAKLLLRAGKLDQGMQELALAARQLPDCEEWTNLNSDFPDDYERGCITPGGRALGELGVLRLARAQYVEALDALLRANYWMDAAYVAERVLTANELVEYVSRNWAGQNPPEDSTAFRIRHLLARRLVRSGRATEARAFLPPQYFQHLDAYVAALRRGRDSAQPNGVRGQALWKAARKCRYHGLELMGAELEPDWYAAYEANFELPPVPRTRAAGGPLMLTASTPDERARTARSAITPAKRWHYRYLAAELAWEAAALLPDGEDETARVLCEAGSWLKDKDPQAADRFYKALVRRCGATTLGREAERRRWFPPLAEEREN